MGVRRFSRICNRYDPESGRRKANAMPCVASCRDRFVHPGDPDWDYLRDKWLTANTGSRPLHQAFTPAKVQDNGWADHHRRRSSTSDANMSMDVDPSSVNMESSSSAEELASATSITTPTSNISALLSNPSFMETLRSAERVTNLNAAKQSESPSELSGVRPALPSSITPQALDTLQKATSSQSLIKALNQVSQETIPAIVSDPNLGLGLTNTAPQRPQQVDTTMTQPLQLPVEVPDSRAVAPSAPDIGTSGQSEEAASDKKPKKEEDPEALKWKAAVKHFAKMATPGQRQEARDRNDAQMLRERKRRWLQKLDAPPKALPSPQLNDISRRLEELQTNLLQQIHEWTATATDTFWPFEPPDGQYLPDEEHPTNATRRDLAEFRAKADELKRVHDSFYNASRKLNEAINLEEQLQRREEAEAAAKAEAEAAVPPEPPEAMYSLSSPEILEFKERVEKVKKDAEGFVRDVSDNVDGWNRDLDEYKQRLKPPTPETSNGISEVPIEELRKLTLDRCNATIVAVNQCTKHIEELPNLKQLKEEETFNLDINYLVASVKDLESRINQLTEEGAREEAEVQQLIKKFQAKLKESEPKPAALPFDEFVDDVAGPIIKDLTEHILKSFQEVKDGVRGVGDDIYSDTRTTIQPGLSVLCSLQKLFTAKILNRHDIEQRMLRGLGAATA